MCVKTRNSQQITPVLSEVSEVPPAGCSLVRLHLLRIAILHITQNITDMDTPNMKQYIVARIYDCESCLPDVVGQFDSLLDAKTFAELCAKTRPDRQYAVYQLV